jgi:hypothetical protein
MRTLKLIVVLGMLAGVAFMAFEWRRGQSDAERLKATVAAENKVIESADAAKRKNDADLEKTLEQLEALKRKVKTPVQAVHALNEILPLPEPINLERKEQPRTAAEFQVAQNAAGALAAPTPSSTSTSASAQLTRQSTPKIAEGSASLPSRDLVPLFNFADDCRAGAARLNAAQADALLDEKKIRALQLGQSAALKAPRGGDFGHRIRIATLWFAVGASSATAAFCVRRCERSAAR